MKRYATPGVGQRYSHFPFRNYPDRFLLLYWMEQRVSSQPEAFTYFKHPEWAC